MKTFLLIVLIILTCWVLYSWIATRSLEEPAYAVTEQRAGYEIRQYESYIVAEAVVGPDFDQGLNQGFRFIADYIFGNNTSADNIAMTVPVLDETSSASSEKISMTVPVIDEQGGEVRKISFVLPSKYTMKTLPKPNRPEVILREVPARTVAAVRFTWYGTEARMKAREASLRAQLERDGVTVTGPAAWAFYNPPASVPFLLRNEVLIPVAFRSVE